MLQRLLLITLTLCSLTASAQWQQTGSKVRYVNGLGIPTKDTAAGVAADSSQIVIRPADSSLYVKYKRTWLRVGAVDTNSISTRLWRQKGIDSVVGLINTKADTNFISTRLWRQKGIDSVVGLINTKADTNFISTRLWRQKGIDSVVGLINTKADTNFISTRLWRQKGIDSVVGLINTKVGSVSVVSPLTTTGGTTPILSMTAATTTQNGYLTATDWTTFNNKQNALVNPTTGTGTINYVPKFTSSTAIGNSQIFDNGTNVGIGTTSPAAKLQSTGAAQTTAPTLGSATGGALYLTNTDLNYGMLFGIARSGRGWIQQQHTDGTGTAYGLILQPSGGNLGIGYTDPAAKLVVDGTTLINTNTDNGVDKLQVNGSVTATGSVTVTNGYMFASGEGNGFMVDAQNGSIPATPGTARTGFMKYGGYEGMIISGNTTKIRLAHRTDSDYVYGGTPTIREDLVITASGNVGIGSYTSPVAKLVVDGTTLINTNTDNGVDKLQVSGSMNVSTLATTNNLSVTTNATVGGNLNVTGTGYIQGTLSGSTFSPSQLNAGSINSASYLAGKAVTLAYTTISSAYTATAQTDYFINVSSGTFTINLYSVATPVGLILVIKNSGAGTVTLDPFGSQTIDGNLTVAMNVQNQTYTIMSDGSNWKIISKYL